MSYIRTDIQIPKQYGSTYDGDGTLKPVCNKDGQTRSRSPNALKTRSTRGRLSYLRLERRSDVNRSENDLKSGTTRGTPLHYP